MNQSLISQSIKDLPESEPKRTESEPFEQNDLLNEAFLVRERVLNHKKANRLLTPKEQKFVERYLIHKKAALAAREAGYTYGVASTKACKWVRADLENPKPWIFKAIYDADSKVQQKAINIAAKHIAKKTIDASYVLEKSVEYLEKSNGEIPTHYKRKIDKDTGEEVLIPVYEYNGTHVGKSIELLGKHKQIKAFDNTLEVEANSTLAGLLSKIGSTTKPPVLQRDKQQDISEGELVADDVPPRPSLLPARPTPTP